MYRTRVLYKKCKINLQTFTTYNAYTVPCSTPHDMIIYMYYNTPHGLYYRCSLHVITRTVTTHMMVFV